MDLPPSYVKTIEKMPDIVFGDDEMSFSLRVVAWGKQESISLTECLRCAKMKWDEFEVKRLVHDIENYKPGALQEGVIRLLKDRYFL